MSRAFVSENDSQFEDQDVPELKNPLPPGAKNYMTPQGAERFKDALRNLEQERSKIAGEVSRSVSGTTGLDKSELGKDRQRLRELDRTLDYMREMIGRLEVVAPSGQDTERVLFGATVTVGSPGQMQPKIYQIVGVPESDPQAGRVSWISPLARSLIGKRVGETATLRLPGGTTKLEILAVDYR